MLHSSVTTAEIVDSLNLIMGGYEQLDRESPAVSLLQSLAFYLAQEIGHYMKQADQLDSEGLHPCCLPAFQTTYNRSAPH